VFRAVRLKAVYPQKYAFFWKTVFGIKITDKFCIKEAKKFFFAKMKNFKVVGHLKDNIWNLSLRGPTTLKSIFWKNNDLGKYPRGID